MSVIAAKMNPQQEKVALALGLKRSRIAWGRWILILLVAAGGAFYFFRGSSKQETGPKWRTATLDMGDIVTTANATGALQPQRSIAVGAEVSGKIDSVLVEVNDTVKKGQILATFDTRSLQNSLQEANASLSAVGADILRAQATQKEAASNESRTLALAQKGAASTKDVEAAQAANNRAAADLKSTAAQAQLSKARKETAKANLEKAVITSPLDGVVLARNVEPGNTVASSFQAPELFVIAEDLHQMELRVSVDEADVGRVKEGQSATFTVAAWPEKQFDATVTKVYLSPTTTSNVVTYTVALKVNNEEGLLRPGMTATATITTGLQKNVLRVPNKALRFTPPQEETNSFRLMGPPMRSQETQHSKSPGVWVLRNGSPTRIAVKEGPTDGRYTEIQSDALKAGDEVLVGTMGASK